MQPYNRIDGGPARMAASKQQLSPLTGIRFFLALWVVVFHQAFPDMFLGPLLPRLPEFAVSILRTGYVSVGVFFVLSGFVLSYNYSLERSWTSSQFIRFGIARFARIYPAYCVGLLLVLPFVGRSLLDDLSTESVARESLAAVLNLTLLQSWVPHLALSWNSPGWSLSAEAFFYCCFPFVGVLLWRTSSGGALLAVGALTWLVSLSAPLLVLTLRLSSLADTEATANDVGPLFTLIAFNPLLRLPEFCVGILLGRAYDRFRAINSPLLGRGYWLYLPGLILEALVIANAHSLPLVMVSNGLLLPLHALLILGLACGGGLPARWLSSRLAVFLGNISYAMYVLHFPISMWIGAVSRRLFLVRPSGLPIMLVYVLVVVGVSAVVYVAIEEPANRFLKSRLSYLQRKV